VNNPKNVLLVEDDKDDQMFFTEALMEIENVTLFDIANNGSEALSKLENAAILPDIIFMDINMPLMNGINCLEVMLKKPVIREIPVVFLTTDISKIEIAYKLGAKGFIEKPNDGKTLRRVMEEMINLNLIADSYADNLTPERVFKNVCYSGNQFTVRNIISNLIVSHGY